MSTILNYPDYGLIINALECTSIRKVNLQEKDNPAIQYAIGFVFQDKEATLTVPFQDIGERDAEFNKILKSLREHAFALSVHSVSNKAIPANLFRPFETR